MTLSGGTTGWSFMSRDWRVVGERSWVSREGRGFMMRDSEERCQSQGVCGFEVMVWRREGMRDQDSGVLGRRS